MPFGEIFQIDGVFGCSDKLKGKLFHRAVGDRRRDYLLFAGGFVCLKYLFCISLFDFLEELSLQMRLHKRPQAGPFRSPIDFIEAAQEPGTVGNWPCWALGFFFVLYFCFLFFWSSCIG